MKKLCMLSLALVLVVACGRKPASEITVSFRHNLEVGPDSLCRPINFTPFGDYRPLADWEKVRLKSSIASAKAIANIREYALTEPAHRSVHPPQVVLEGAFREGKCSLKKESKGAHPKSGSYVWTEGDQCPISAKREAEIVFRNDGNQSVTRNEATIRERSVSSDLLSEESREETLTAKGTTCKVIEGKVLNQRGAAIETYVISESVSTAAANRALRSSVNTRLGVRVGGIVAEFECRYADSETNCTLNGVPITRVESEEYRVATIGFY